jgi:hypothetical protein
MDAKSNELNLTINFQQDWVEILRQKLVERGYSIDSSQHDSDALCIQYFNVLKRQIDAKPREILVSKEFSCPEQYRKGIKLIRRKVKSGQDLTPHLSKNIKSLDYHDSLLNDWGIYHFHLGDLLEKTGFIKRTGPVLFARVTDEYFYMLDILDHGSWSQQRLVEIIHTNWQESISLFKIQGLYKLNSVTPSDQDIAQFRKHGISTLIQVSDGTIYSSLGGGYSRSGISTDVRVTCSCYSATVRRLEKHVRNNLSNLRDIARQHNLELPPQPHFQLQIVDGNAYAVELNTKIFYPLCEMPLRIMGSL